MSPGFRQTWFERRQIQPQNPGESLLRSRSLGLARKVESANMHKGLTRVPVCSQHLIYVDE